MSDESWSATPRLIGDLERGNHYHLRDSDVCYYWGSYTAHKGYSHSDTNGLISNLKKCPTLRGTAQWPYKERAMSKVAQVIKRSLIDALPSMAIVPVPPSKLPTDPRYDNRMSSIANSLAPAHFYPKIIAVTSRGAAHESEETRSVQELRDSLSIDEGVQLTDRPTIAILDDVITTGRSFIVCKDMILSCHPNAHVIGLFAARRVIPNPFGPISDLSGLFG